MIQQRHRWNSPCAKKSIMLWRGMGKCNCRSRPS